LNPCPAEVQRYSPPVASTFRSLCPADGPAGQNPAAAPPPPGRTRRRLTQRRNRELPHYRVDSTGDSLTEADSVNIDKVGVQVSATATAATVSDLCMTKIEFGN
jgi:hypothetical protein